MISYKCAYCKASLGTDDFLGGKSEPCPECGKNNLVPESPQSLREKRELGRRELERLEESLRVKREEERLKRERLEAQEEMANELRDVPRKDMLGQQDKGKHAGSTNTETALNIIGILYVIVGISVGLVFVPSAKEGPSALLMVVASPLVGFVIGIPCFMCSLVLKYLRRIMNAVESPLEHRA